MPGVSSTRTPTRCRAACTGSACPSSMRCRRSCSCASGATARSTRSSSPTAIRSTRCASSGRPASTSGGQEKRGTAVTFWPSTETFTMVEFDYGTVEHRLRELAFLNSGVRIILTDARRAEVKREELFYEGGLEAFVRYLDRAKASLIAKPILMKGEKDGMTVEVALWWNDTYHETVLPFTNNIPQRDGGTHLAGLPRRPDPPGDRLCRALRHRQEGEGRRHRRRLPRGPDLRPVGEGAGPEVLVADQGQAGLLRGAARRREHRQRDARAAGSRSTRPTPRPSPARWPRPRRRARRPARRAS